MAQKPAARPSMPSMKLTMLAIATTHSTVTSTDHQPRLKTPTNGRVTWSMRMPNDTGTAAIATRPAIFTPGCSETMSSKSPRHSISVAPSMIPQKP